MKRKIVIFAFFSLLIGIAYYFIPEQTKVLAERSSAILISDKQFSKSMTQYVLPEKEPTDIVTAKDLGNQEWLINIVEQQLSPKKIDDIEQPIYFGDLQTITYIGVFESSQISGQIPEGIGYFTGLTKLFLLNNPGLTGEMPESFSLLTNLEEFSIGSSADFPNPVAVKTNVALLQPLHKLKKLTLSLGADKYGEMPAWTNFPELESVNLLNRISAKTDKKVSGTLDGIETLDKLFFVDLGFNNFSGKIPEKIGNLVNLQYLRLSANNFSGGIPNSVGNLINLIEFQLGDTKVEGTLNKNIFTLPKLENLQLQRTKIGGRFPSLENEKAAPFTYFTVSSTKLVGQFPQEILTLPSLTLISVANTQLTVNSDVTPVAPTEKPWSNYFSNTLIVNNSQLSLKSVNKINAGDMSEIVFPFRQETSDSFNLHLQHTNNAKHIFFPEHTFTIKEINTEKIVYEGVWDEGVQLKWDTSIAGYHVIMDGADKNPNNMTTIEIKKPWTVTFDSTGGSTVPSQLVKDGDKVVNSDDPILENKKFMGWYEDPMLTKKWGFSTPVTQDRTLYAKWRSSIVDPEDGTTILTPMNPDDGTPNESNFTKEDLRIQYVSDFDFGTHQNTLNQLQLKAAGDHGNTPKEPKVVPAFISVIDDRPKMSTSNWELRASTTDFSDASGSVLKGARLFLSELNYAETSKEKPDVVSNKIELSKEETLISSTGGKNIGNGTWSLAFGSLDADQRTTGVTLDIAQGYGKNQTAYSATIDWELVIEP